MSTNRQNYELWYAKILRDLSGNGDAGFAILLISLPLLERYLREKSGVYEGSLNSNFYLKFRQIFPAIQDDATAEKFWHVYRNGLLHQVTLSRKNRSGLSMPDAWLSSEVASVTVDAQGDFWVHPAKFAEIVLSTIEGDFTMFEGGSSPNHPFPVVSGISNGTGAVPPYDIPPTGVP
ncbi:MAG: hypothetical protein PHE83_06920 [Opitutaceae bacterium]|nr:hypothetical protein [Opitutaceae bacterium]